MFTKSTLDIGEVYSNVTIRQKSIMLINCLKCTNNNYLRNLLFSMIVEVYMTIITIKTTDNMFDVTCYGYYT